jgi:hypothetical protein
MLMLQKILVGAALMGIAAVPGYCTAILSFGVGGGFTGNIAVNGQGTSQTVASNFSLSGFNSLSVTGAPSSNGNYTLTNTSLNYNTATKTLTLLGAISSLSGLSSQTTLLTIVYGGSGLLGDTSNSTLSLNLFNNTTSITESSTLLSDLGFTPTSTISTLSSGDKITTGSSTSNSGGVYNYTASSETLMSNVTATPEPASLVLLGGGLMALGFRFRRRRRN